MMPFVEPARALEDAPIDPNHEMWVWRFTRDGQPREMHARRHEVPDPRGIAQQLAEDTGSLVAYTAVYITAHYHWQWPLAAGPFSPPLWVVVEPQAVRRVRRVVESCPNGCGGGRS